MKSILSIFAFVLTTSAQAQFADQKITFLICTGGTGSNFTTLTLTTGGFVGGTYARIQTARFNSGEMRIARDTGGIGIPENRTYKDVATQGKRFTFTYDFLNTSGFNALSFTDSSGNKMRLPPLTCNAVR